MNDFKVERQKKWAHIRRKRYYYNNIGAFVRSQWPCVGKHTTLRHTVVASAVVACRTAVPFRVDRSTIGRYLGADWRTYHLVTSHLAVDAETSFARRPCHANHGLSQRYQPSVNATICGQTKTKNSTNSSMSVPM